MKKNAIVTGAASGLGKGIADCFLKNGWNVLLLDISEESLAKTAAEFANAKLINFKAFVGDVRNENDVNNAVEMCAKVFLGIDCLVNNAGIGITKPIEETSVEEWHRVIDTNLTSIFLAAKYSAKYLRASHGSMVNIASTRALMSEANTESYSASKGGVLAITHALAMSLAPVRVNCISPGWINNDPAKQFSEADKSQHPVGRIGTPSDIGELALFLASEKSSFITGQNFCCDGGMTKKMIYV